MCVYIDESMGFGFVSFILLLVGLGSTVGCIFFLRLRLVACRDCITIIYTVHACMCLRELGVDPSLTSPDFFFSALA